MNLIIPATSVTRRLSVWAFVPCDGGWSFGLTVTEGSELHPDFVASCWFCTTGLRFGGEWYEAESVNGGVCHGESTAVAKVAVGH